MKKRLALILLLALVLQCFALTSCVVRIGGKNNTVIDPPPPPPDGDEDVNITNKDWKGASFKVLTYADRGEGTAFNVVDLVADDGNLSDVINKAVYERNELIQSLYNAKIERSDEINYLAILSNTLAYGSEYSAYMINPNRAITMARCGDLLDFNSEVGYINIRESWWDTSAIESVAVNNRVYFVMGDINTVDNDASWCVIFNKYLKDRCADINMPDFYELVNNGDWTVEALSYWASRAVSDYNGDSSLPKWSAESNYRYGLYFQNECAIALLQSTGITPYTKGTNGDFQSNIYSPEFENTINSIRDCIMLDNAVNNAWALNINDIYDYSGGDVWKEIARGGFKADKALFYMCHVGTVSLIRDMEHDFGILPLPKVVESQEKYGNTVQYSNATCYVIPYNTYDSDFSGFMLEAMCFYSGYEWSSIESLKAAYYESLLRRKGSRDDSSEAMLNIIFDNRIFDISCIQNIENINNLIIASAKSSDKNWSDVIGVKSNSMSNGSKIDYVFVECIERLKNGGS